MFNAHSLMPGAKEVCKELKQSGINLAMASNAPSKMLINRLKLAGIYDCFEIEKIYASEDIVGCRKPAPEFYEYIKVNNPEVESSRILMIGDSWKSDMIAARKAGISTCWYNPKASPRPEQGICNYEVVQLLALLKILGINQDIPEEFGRLN